MEFMEVALSQIVVMPNRRKPKPAMVNAIAASILEIGLQCPIGVVKDGRGYKLVHGRTRLEAVRSMNRPTITAIVHDLDELHAQLAEIDENIQRHNLSAAEEMKALARRKEIYEALHPETKPVRVRGGPGRGGKTNDKMTPVSFTEDTATKTGKSRRTVERDVATGQKLSDKAVEKLADTSVADDKTQLKQLAELPPDQQEEVASDISKGKRTRVPRADKPEPSFAEALEGFIVKWMRKHGTASYLIAGVLESMASQYRDAA